MGYVLSLLHRYNSRGSTQRCSYQRASETLGRMHLGKGRSDHMDPIFHLGVITTGGDELSPRHLDLFAESLLYSRCSSLLRKPECKQAGAR